MNTPTMRPIIIAVVALALASCGSAPTPPRAPVLSTPADFPAATPSTSTTATAAPVAEDVDAPRVRATKAKAPRGVTTQSKPSAYYKSCAAAKSAGAAPLHRGGPGYRSALDRDGDGTACET